MPSQHPPGRLRGWDHCHAKAAALTDASVTTNGTPESAAAASFPPTDLGAFLQCCAGDWLSLRSRFNLGSEQDAVDPSTAMGVTDSGAHGEPLNDADDNSWHASERAELSVTLLDASGDGHGGLALQVKGQTAVQQAYFHADGRFGSDLEPEAGITGTWTLWPDGSLDLVIDQGEKRLRERIWFTKPNLRLRSTVEQQAGGSPGRASFSSEIRRVPRPPAPAPSTQPTTGAS